VIDPAVVGLIDQFTRELLTLSGLAVHVEVVSTVTSRGVQETVMVGVTAVEAAPQELRNASPAAAPNKKSTFIQRDFILSKWSFSSDTRNPPARATVIFPRKACKPSDYQALSAPMGGKAAS
jgi:hypothetical protein